MSKRRFALLAVCVALAGAVVTLPAGAQTAEQLKGSALAEALTLEIFGEGITLGSAEVVATQAKVDATGIGAAPLADDSTVAASVTQGSADPEKKCAQSIAFPPDRDELLIDLACGDAKAALNEGGPAATANGTVGNLELALLQELSEQLIAPIQEGLEELFGELPDELDPATDTVSDLLLALAEQGKLLDVEIGDAESSVTTTADQIVYSATAEAGRIDIVPGAGLDGSPLASIIVGSSQASAICARATGATSTEFDPAVVRVILNAPLLGEPQEIPVALGEPVTILEGTPLESTISLGASTETKNDDGSVTGTADGVSLHLLKGIPEADQGIRLALAHSEVTAGCTPAVAAAPTTTTTAPPAVAPVELPRTGGDSTTVPFIGVGLLGVAVLLRRAVGRRG